METISQEEFKKRYGTQGVIKVSQPIKKPTMGEIIGKAFKGGIEQVKEGVQQVGKGGTNPLSAAGNLIEGVGKVGSGAIGAAFSPLAPAIEPTIGKAVSYAGEQISKIPAVQKFAESKIGQGVARGAENVLNYANIAGTVGSGMVAPKVGSAIKMGTNTAIEGVGNIASKATETTGRVLKKSGESAYGLTIAPEESTARALMSYDAKQPTFMGRVKNMLAGTEKEIKPITEANTAARKGLMGTEYQLGVQAKKLTNDLWTKEIQPKLKAIKGAVDMKSFIGDIEKQIKKVGDITRRNDLMTALEKVKEDYKNVSKVSAEKLQQYKEGWAEFVPESVYKGKPIGTSLKAVHDLMASKARQMFYKLIGEEGKTAYLDYGNLQSIIKSGLKSITGDPATKSLSRNVWSFIMNKAVTPVATVAGKVLYKTGEGLEFIGKKGAKTVKDIK